MADVKISQLPTGTPTGASLIPIVENGVTSQTTPSALVSVATSSLKAGNGDYTLAPEDVGQVVVSNVGAPATFTLTDSSGFPVGGVIEIIQDAAGQLTLAEGAGTTIKRSRFATLELGGEGSTVRLRKQSAGTWIASGDLKERPVGTQVQFTPSSTVTTGNSIPVDSVNDILTGGPATIQAFSKSGSVMTCLIGGTYQVSGQILLSSTSSGTTTVAQILGVVNGTQTGSSLACNGTRQRGSNTTDSFPVDVDGCLTLESGNTLEFRINAGSNTITTASSFTYQKIYIVRVGD